MRLFYGHNPLRFGFSESEIFLVSTERTNFFLPPEVTCAIHVRRQASVPQISILNTIITITISVGVEIPLLEFHSLSYSIIP